MTRHCLPGKTLILVILALFLGILSSCAARGEKLFEEEGCLHCHSFKGKGGRMAPDLTAVTGRRDDAWIRHQIRDSKQNDPRSRMPSFAHLSEFDIRSIVNYLKKP